MAETNELFVLDPDYLHRGTSARAGTEAQLIADKYFKVESNVAEQSVREENSAWQSAQGVMM